MGEREGRGGGRGFTGKVVDIKRNTKNPKSRLVFNFPFLCMGLGLGEAQGRSRKGEVLAGEWEQLFSYVTHCINLINIALDFSSRYSIGLPSYGLHKNNLSSFKGM